MKAYHHRYYCGAHIHEKQIPLRISRRPKESNQKVLRYLSQYDKSNEFYFGLDVKKIIIHVNFLLYYV